MVTILFSLSLYIVIASYFVKKAREMYDITSITTAATTENECEIANWLSIPYATNAHLYLTNKP